MHGQGDSFAFDTHLNESIPFSNPSDAKIARLVLTFDLPLKTVDLFLNIVNDETFKISEVSIHQAKDIYQHVSEFRAKRAMVRANQQLRRPGLFSSEANAHTLPVASINPFPLLIVDLVIEELMRQYVSVLSPGRYKEETFHLQQFSTMSLVHRSWTIPAQHALVYLIRLYLNASWQMRNFACSPFPLMWTRDLSIVLTCFEYDERGLSRRPVYHETRKRPNRLDGCQLINLALPHFSNVQHLTVVFRLRQVGGDDFAMPYGWDILRHISNFTSLQELCVNVGPWKLLLMMCTMLPSLQCLRKFTARSYGEYCNMSRAYETLERSLSGLTPPRSLECVSFDMGDDHIDPIPRILEWLTRPRKDWSIKSFCLNHEGWGAQKLTFLQTKQVFDDIQMALPRLSSLELHAFIPEEDVDSVRGADVLRMILQNCTSLNRLAVCLQLMKQRDDVIPDDVEDILMDWAPPTLPVILLRHNHEIETCCLFDETEHAFVRC